MFLTILIVIIFLLESIYYIYFINTHKQETIEYFRDIPSNENPAIVGLMVKGNVDGNDIVATILDLWKKDYINVEYRIINGEQKCIIKDAGKDRFLILKDYENYLLDELFKDNQEVILDDFVKTPKFEIIFKNVGNMINRRVNLKKVHKVSYKRLTSKVNFLVNYIVLGFAMFFSIIYMISNNFLLSLIAGFAINIILIVLIKAMLVKEEKSVEGLLFGITSAISVVYFGVLIIAYLLGNYTYQYNQYLEIGNVAISILMLLCFFLGDYNKKSDLTPIDYIIFLYAIPSIIFGNIMGLCVSIVYLSHRIYLKSPKHSYLSKGNEIDKWIALKKFLNDFSIIGQRDMMEVKVWDKYLIYGIAMGVNRKIILEYAKLADIKLINTTLLDSCYSENILF